MNDRHFKVAPTPEGEPPRVVIPPKGLLTGPGGRHRRFASGDVLSLPPEKVDRFIRNRARAGDLIEISAAEALAAETPAPPCAAPVAPPASPFPAPAPARSTRPQEG